MLFNAHLALAASGHSLFGSPGAPLTTTTSTASSPLAAASQLLAAGGPSAFETVTRPRAGSASPVAAPPAHAASVASQLKNIENMVNGLHRRPSTEK
ncbi:hypothetical protein FJT64_008505 [Amphibalanus amphitrite]|uniref:Uncharacterized protein n=1 Tax=Amphibalanus amphitrite TaxID=1232801 RepID=A0A6A4VBQ9_AMPAM|nr:hypothetical protein FJT64_008505 [Amphibalanus amphitrite]